MSGRIKVRLELQTPETRQHLRTIELASMPCVGEKFETGEEGTLEVIDVVRTPHTADYAIVIVKRDRD